METQVKTSMQEKRTTLKDLSNKAQETREQMLHGCFSDEERQAVNAIKVNDIIIDTFYKTEVHQEFKTFKGWIKEGFAVNKGQKGFLVWGRPSQENKEGKTEEIIESDGKGRFFPISYIFSNAQVSPLKKRENA